MTVINAVGNALTGQTGTGAFVGADDPTFSQVELVHTAGASDDHALEIDCNAAGFADVKAIDIVYVTGALAANDEEGVILVSINDSAAVGGEVVGLEVITTPGNSNVIAVRAGALVAPIEQLSGTFGNADSILNKAVDVTAALASGGAGNISAFVADNDTMTFGDAATFEEISFLLDTAASGSGIAPTFRYSTGVGTWASFTPTDGTNGMRFTGVIVWDLSDVPTWAVGAGALYLIEITRTRNTLATTPILDEVQISAVVEYSWDKDGDLSVKSLTLTTDLTVANGGTGASSQTAYAVLCGGTTTTNPFQSVASLGSAGEQLTSNGAGLLPTWQSSATSATALNALNYLLMGG